MPAKKIVVVDDEESIRKTFFLILNKNYKVYLAKDGEEALARFKNVQVDLVIADYRLPDMNGLDLIGALRQTGYRGEVIMISAFAELIEPDTSVPTPHQSFLRQTPRSQRPEPVDRLSPDQGRFSGRPGGLTAFVSFLF